MIPYEVSAAPRLEGMVAVVTGAASGIGRSITERFLAEGARVVAGDTDGGAVRQLAQDRCVALEADALDESAQLAMVETAQQEFGRLDIAVANVGGGSGGLLVDLPVEEWRRVADLCTTSAFLTVKHAGRVMARHGAGGSIVTIASLSGLQPGVGSAAYCSAKAAVVMLTKVAALELGPVGIRCNAIAPGLVRTPATEATIFAAGWVEEFVDNTAIGRFGETADVADLALFLASPESSFITGTVHLVDGGAALGRYPRRSWRADPSLGWVPAPCTDNVEVNG